MKWLTAMFVIVILMFVVSGVQADLIVVTLPEFNSPYHDVGTYYDDYLVGTFTYDIDGLTILSASISGQWGNSLSGTTAHNELWLDGIELADTHDYSPDPYWYGGPWAYVFAPSEFAVLADGSAEFHTIQTSEYVVRLAETTLEIDAVGIEVEKELIEVDDDDGDGLIEVGEETSFLLRITVTNPNTDYAIDGVEVKDRLGGDLMLSDYAASTGTLSTYTKGKTEKVFLTWDVGTLAAEATATLDLTVATDINPGTGNGKKPGHQEYTEAGEHELNSGATVKGMVGDVKVSATSDPITVDVVEPD